MDDDDEDIRQRAAELRALARQRDGEAAARRTAERDAVDRFRDGVLRFATVAAQRLTDAGMPTVGARPAPVVVQPRRPERRVGTVPRSSSSRRPSTTSGSPGTC